MRDVLEIKQSDGVEEYQLIIYGEIPEVGQLVSCRRIAPPPKRGRKLVKCPYSGCDGRLTETDSDTKVEVHRKSDSRILPSQFHLTCQVCKREVGIRIICSI